MGEICRAVEPLLSAHIDRELDPAEVAQVRAHLAACDGCAAAAEELRVVRSLVRSLPVRRLPDDVALRAPGPAPAASREGAPTRVRVGAALAVAAGLLTGAAFSLGGQPAPDTRVVSVPMDVYVADHFVHTANRALSLPVTLETRR